MSSLRPMRSLPCLRAAASTSAVPDLPQSACTMNEKDLLALQQSNHRPGDVFGSLSTAKGKGKLGITHEEVSEATFTRQHKILGDRSYTPHLSRPPRKSTISRHISGTTSKLKQKASRFFSRKEQEESPPVRASEDYGSRPTSNCSKQGSPCTPSEKFAKQLEKCYATSVSSHRRSPTSSPLLTPPSLTLHSVSSRTGTSSSPRESEASSFHGIEENFKIYPPTSEEADVGFPFPIMAYQPQEIAKKLPVDVLESFGNAAAGALAHSSYPFLSTTPPSPKSHRSSLKDSEPLAFLRRHTVENLPLSFEPSRVFPPPPRPGRSNPSVEITPSLRPQLVSAFSDWTTGDTASDSGRMRDNQTQSDGASLRTQLLRTNATLSSLQLSDWSISPGSPLSPFTLSIPSPSAQSDTPSPNTLAALSPSPRGKLVNCATQTEQAASTRTSRSGSGSKTSLEDILPTQVVLSADKVRIWRERAVLSTRPAGMQEGSERVAIA